MTCGSSKVIVRKGINLFPTTVVCVLISPDTHNPDLFITKEPISPVELVIAMVSAVYVPFSFFSEKSMASVR